MFTWTEIIRRTAFTAALCGALGAALYLVLSAAARAPGLHLWLAIGISLPTGVVLTRLAVRAWSTAALPIGRTLLRRADRPREFVFWTLWIGVSGVLSCALGLWSAAQLVASAFS